MTGMVLFVCITLCLVACTRTLYVPVESVRTEYRDQYQRDSICQYDSVYFAVKGDTVWLEKYRTIYKNYLRVDSFIRTDTISIPYPVEKQLSGWQQTKMNVGGWAIGALSGIFIACIVYKLFRVVRIKKKIV